MAPESLMSKLSIDSSSDPINAPTPSELTRCVAKNTLQEVAVRTASEQAESQEFSIDELREIARQFGVPNRAQITEREALVEAIRHRT